VTGIRRGRNANLYSTTTPWDEVQREKMQSMVDETYRRFKRVVSDGRGLTVDEVEDVAGGRVWTAKRAVTLGLVDELGSLQDAIADARNRAGIPLGRKVGLVSYGSGGSMFESLAPSLIGQALGPLDDWALARRQQPELAREIDALKSVLPSATPALLQLSSPETTVWMVDPWLVDLSIQ
jgi:ClpP class serine protease